MTITAQDARDEYTATAGQTIFNYTFKIYADTELDVYITPSGQEADDSADLTTAYTVDPSTIGDPDGGFITLDSGANSGDLVTIVSSMPYNRTVDYQNSGDFLPDTVNGDNDRQVSQIKQVADLANRSLLFPQSLQNASSLSLPLPDAGLYLKWNAGETGLENTGAPVQVIYNSTIGTVAELKASASIGEGEIVITMGYSSTGDGGDNVYISRAVTGASDDGGSVIKSVGNPAIEFVGVFPGGVVNIAQFGAIGDGSTLNKVTNKTALENAMAYSDHVLIPEGDFAIDVTSFYVFTPPANCTLYGVSNEASKLTAVVLDTVSRNLFRLANDNFIFRDICIDTDAPAAASLQFFLNEANNVRIQDSEFDGGNTSINANLVNFMTFVNSDTANLYVKNCDIHNVQRVILRDISRTGIISNVEFSNNEIHDLGEGGVQFNTPGYNCRNIRILGNHFREFHSGTEQIFCGGASVDGFTVQGNTFNDNGNECLHFEEDGNDIAITGNIFKADARGVALFSNDVGGTPAMPKRVVITGNTFFDGSLTRSNEGINAPITAVGAANNIDSYEDLIVDDNTFRGYDLAVYCGKTPVKMTSNTITNCNTGFQCSIPWPEVFDNTFENCGTAIFSLQEGGMVGSNYFRAPLAIADSTDNSKISMTGFKLSLESDINLPSSTITNVNLGISVGAEMFGDSKVMVYMDDPSLYQHRISETYYDGATLTDTEKMRNGSGGVSFNGLVNNAGALAVALNNTTGSDQTLSHLTIEFNGMWVSTT
tara:strand:+ start:312 stop:2615 length:2304 start_codon:yes stop_codon:yes gene_type:complete